MTCKQSQPTGPCEGKTKRGGPCPGHKLPRYRFCRGCRHRLLVEMEEVGYLEPEVKMSCRGASAQEDTVETKYGPRESELRSLWDLYADVVMAGRKVV